MDEIKRTIMKKLIPVIKVIPKLRDAAIKQTIKLSEKTIAKTEKANNFLTEVADIFSIHITHNQRNFFP